MQGPYVVFNNKRYLSAERLAIIKALLCKGKEIDLKGLNPEHPDAAYHCGRLLAVLDSVYVHFINSDKPKGAKWTRPKSTVSARYYGSASASPASVYGALIHGSRAHLTKLRGSDKDFGYELKLEEICQSIGTEFPKTLDMRRQGIFALGYYHQTASDRAARELHGVKVEDIEEEGDEA